MHCRRSPIAVLIAAGLACALQSTVDAVDVRVEFDRKFDFKKVRTWAWNPAGAGGVKMARTVYDDPDAGSAWPSSGFSTRWRRR